MENIIDVIKAVSYDALNEAQKAQAIEIMRALENQDSTPYWSVDITDQWKADLDTEYGIYNAEIEWSGFCSQGDGASISTDYYINLEKFLRKVKAWSKFRRLHRIIADEEIHAKVNRGSSRYSHENTVSGSVELDYNIDFTHKQVLASEVLEEFLTDTIRDLSSKVYKELDDENDYQSSDEALWSTIEANEYDFKVNQAGEVLGIA
jgi:hypothetical protein